MDIEQLLELDRRADSLPRTWFKRRKAVAGFIADVGLPAAEAALLSVGPGGIVNREIDRQVIAEEARYLAEEQKLSRALADGKFIVSKGE